MRRSGIKLNIKGQETQTFDQRKATQNSYHANRVAITANRSNAIQTLQASAALSIAQSRQTSLYRKGPADQGTIELSNEEEHTAQDQILDEIREQQSQSRLQMIWKRKSNHLPKNDNSDLNFTFTQNNQKSKEDCLEKPLIKNITRVTPNIYTQDSITVKARRVEAGTELFVSCESPKQQFSLENIMLQKIIAPGDAGNTFNVTVLNNGISKDRKAVQKNSTN